MKPLLACSGPDDATARAAITGVILAGGRGQRMNAADKGLVHLRGKPLALWVAERLAPQVGLLLINANRNVERYAGFGWPVFVDRQPGFAGPLAGLHAALAEATTPFVVTAPCDSPFLPGNLVARLAAARHDTGARLAVARSGGRLQPVFCLCRRELCADLERFLADGGRRFQEWCNQQDNVIVDFDDAGAFENINTPQELSHFE